MNILFLSTWFPYPPNNGSKIRANYILKALALNHHVTAVSFQQPNELAGDNQKELVDVPKNIDIHTVTVDPFRYVMVPQVIKYVSPIPVACWPSENMRNLVRKLTQTKQFDVVVAFQLPVAQYGLQIKHVPRVFDLDVSFSFQRHIQLESSSNMLSKMGLRKAFLYEKRVLQQYDVCTLVSDIETEYFRKKISSVRFETNPNGVDCAHNQVGLALARPNSLVYNGALTYSANYDAMRYFLAEVWPLVCAEIPEVVLTITGSTKGVDLAGLALTDNVVLSGYVNDIRLVVAEAAICVVPLREGGGTRLKILEAMALGTPVVATSKGAEGLVAQDGVHLLLADRPELFAQQVIRLLRDEPLRNKLAGQARQLVEAQYDWQQIGAQFVALVDETVRKVKEYVFIAS
jgi:glycosyltransferase involved in cell wall biosynthesis